MRAIVSVTDDWGIGNKGQLLVPNKADMAHFVKNTMGATVVMGRKTLESFPGGPLKGRTNIVLTSDSNNSPEGVLVYHNIDELLLALNDRDPDSVWLIGGASLYKQLLPFCSSCLVTKNHTIVAADSYFPNLDQSPEWELAEQSVGGTTQEGIPFDFCTYKHI